MKRKQSSVQSQDSIGSTESEPIHPPRKRARQILSSDEGSQSIDGFDIVPDVGMDSNEIEEHVAFLSGAFPNIDDEVNSYTVFFIFMVITISFDFELFCLITSR